MNEADGFRMAAVAAYAGSQHGKLVLRGIAVLCHLHRPDSPETALVCPTCRDSRGRRAPWPCQTYIEISRALGSDPGPALRLAGMMGLKLPPALDIDALEYEQRMRTYARDTDT